MSDLAAALRVAEAVIPVLEKGWTQGALARDSDGDPVDPDDPYATCWCLRGAVMLVCKIDPTAFEPSDSEAVLSFGETFRPGIGYATYTRWNDDALSAKHVIDTLRDFVAKLKDELRAA